MKAHINSNNPHRTLQCSFAMSSIFFLTAYSLCVRYYTESSLWTLCYVMDNVRQTIKRGVWRSLLRVFRQIGAMFLLALLLCVNVSIASARCTCVGAQGGGCICCLSYSPASDDHGWRIANAPMPSAPLPVLRGNASVLPNNPHEIRSVFSAARNNFSLSQSAVGCTVPKPLSSRKNTTANDLKGIYSAGCFCGCQSSTEGTIVLVQLSPHATLAAGNRIFVVNLRVIPFHSDEEQSLDTVVFDIDHPPPESRGHNLSISSLHQDNSAIAISCPVLVRTRTLAFTYLTELFKGGVNRDTILLSNATFGALNCFGTQSQNALERKRNKITGLSSLTNGVSPFIFYRNLLHLEVPEHDESRIMSNRCHPCVHVTVAAGRYSSPDSNAVSDPAGCVSNA